METRKNISLKPFNTFHLDVSADLFAEINSAEDITQLVKDISIRSSMQFVLGGGSNILFTGNVKGIVIKNNLKGIEKIREDRNSVWVRSGSGETWHQLVMHAVNNNLGGIENLSLIPGTVGAAPIQNIGAYGAELKDVFEELEAIHLHTGEHRIFTHADCKFGYRDSVFKREAKGHYLITSVTLRLSKHPVLNTSYGAIETELKNMGVTEKTIQSVSEAVINIRQSKLPDPAVIGNAGSFFKNPEVPAAQYDELKKHFPELTAYPAAGNKMKLAAGWLIEQCGWKGKVSGNVGMHARQALVLVNYGNATGAELFLHAKKVRASVMEKFGVELEMEVNIL